MDRWRTCLLLGPRCGGCVRRVHCPCTYLLYFIFAIFISTTICKDSVLYSKKFLIKKFLINE